jgi:hypothetical protein
LRVCSRIRSLVTGPSCSRRLMCKSSASQACECTCGGGPKVQRGSTEGILRRDANSGDTSAHDNIPSSFPSSICMISGKRGGLVQQDISVRKSSIIRNPAPLTLTSIPFENYTGDLHQVALNLDDGITYAAREYIRAMRMCSGRYSGSTLMKRFRSLVFWSLY